MLSALLERFVIWRYATWGKDWGEWASYAFDHEANPCDNALNRWERFYTAFGYEAVPREVWVEAGGYGQPYESYLRKPIAVNP